MLTKRSVLALICLTLAGFWTPSGASESEGGTRNTLSAAITISGTSTVRDWSCKGPADIEVFRSNGADAVPGFPGGIESVRISVAIEKLDCENGNKKMTEHMRKALKAKEHPQIIYSMTQYTARDAASIHVRGGLLIGGVIWPTELNATLQAIDGKGVRANGETQIDMRNFSLKPPSLFLGTVKVDPLVRVQFSAEILNSDPSTTATNFLESLGRLQ